MMFDEGEDHGYQDYNKLKSKKMKYEVKPDIIRLTHKPKYLYPLFNLFQLQVNRFQNLAEFKQLSHQIVSFNEELDNWKKNNKEVKNLFLTYHLYQNLFSRMKYTSSLVLDRNEAQRGLKEIAKWFFEEKPKVRNRAPPKDEATLKPSTADKETEDEVDSLLVSNAAKRELKPFEAMARTSHQQFFPPKERLLEYKKRDLLEGIEPPRRALSVASLNKGGMTRYKGSFAATRTTFYKTTTQGIRQSQSQHKVENVKQEPMVVPFQVEEKKTEEAVIPVLEESEPNEDLLKERQVQQEDILQENIIQVVHEEDQVEGEEDILSEDEKEKANQKFRKYRVDPSAQDEMKAQQNIKDAKQSTLRRILKEKQEAVRRKMEELNMAQQAKNWSAIKSKQNTEEHRKLQRMLLANKFRQMEYTPAATMRQKQFSRKKDIPQFEAFYRSKSSNQGSIESQLQKLKINNALKTYGKYINHVNIAPVQLQTEDERQQMRVMRTTSLTSFCRQGKKTPFSSIVQRNGVENHNEDVLEYISKIKDRFAKTALPIQKKQLLKGLQITDTQRMALPDKSLIYPPQKSLLSNPFFPKHLYQNKSKKKKK